MLCQPGNLNVIRELFTWEMELKRKLMIAFGLLAAAVQSAKADLMDDCRAERWVDASLSACSKIILSSNFGSDARALAYRFRGELRSAAGAFRDAVADFDESLRLREDPLAFAGRGWARFSTRDFAGAIRDYDHAIQLRPEVASFYLERGHVYLANGKLDDSIRDLSAAIRLNPDNASAYNNRGLAFRRKGDLEAALRDYNRAIEINPVYALAFANRGHLEEALGRKKAAIADLQQALLFDPALVDARNSLARLGDVQPIAIESDLWIKEGQRLAETDCSGCHAVGLQGKSPYDRAPEFRNLRRANTLLALREPITRAIVTQHAEMPHFILSNEQIDKLVAYINSLSMRR